jgi:hypothetical protein
MYIHSPQSPHQLLIVALLSVVLIVFISIRDNKPHDTPSVTCCIQQRPSSSTHLPHSGEDCLRCRLHHLSIFVVANFESSPWEGLIVVAVIVGVVIDVIVVVSVIVVITGALSFAATAQRRGSFIIIVVVLLLHPLLITVIAIIMAQFLPLMDYFPGQYFLAHSA